MIGSRAKWNLAVVLAVGLGASLWTSSAEAQNGFWSWGTPGFSAGMSPVDRGAYVVNQGLADPSAGYWTPFWQAGSDPNYYTGVPDTGYQNTFAVNHDINANYGIPVLGYLDIFTPLIGTNELAIASTVSSIWGGIVDAVSSVWNSVTSIFSSDYTSYNNTGTYSDYSYDNAFDTSYSGYGTYSGDGDGDGDGDGG
jgi:hypothetical protein